MLEKYKEMGSKFSWTMTKPMTPLEEEFSLKVLIYYYVLECKLVQPLWRTVWRFLKKWKLELPYDPAICIYSEKTLLWKMWAPSAHSSTTDNSQDLEAL